MYGVSAALKERLESCEYKPYTNLQISTAAGVLIASIRDKAILPGTCKITGGSTSSGSFEMGAAVIGKLEATVIKSALNTSALKKIQAGTKVAVYFGISYGSTTTGISKGIFYLDDPEDTDYTLKLTGYTAMSKLDREFDATSLKKQGNLYGAVKYAAKQCGVSTDGTYFDSYKKYINAFVSSYLETNSCTCREFLMMIGGCTGNYIDINRSGELGLKWYNTYALDEVDEMEENGDVSALDTFSAAREYHVIKYKMLRSFTHWKNALEIDDVMFRTKNRYDARWYGSGLTKSYVLVARASQNPFIYYPSSTEWAGDDYDDCDYPNPNAVWNHISNNGTVRPITPMTLTAPTDPSIEVGDPIVVYDDRSGSVYKAYVTNMTMTSGGSMQLVCDAETPARHAEKNAEAEETDETDET